LLRAEPWQKAEIAGPTRAFTITKPAAIAGLLGKAKRPILIVGHQAAELELGDSKSIDYAIRLSEIARIPLVATGHAAGEFRRRGFDRVVSMPLVDVANRLTDESWKGLDGNGQYDLALFMGIQYYMEWVTLSGLKHFASSVTTVSLDPFYQPHATWSFPNMPLENWQQSLDELIDKIQTPSSSVSGSVAGPNTH